jgi:tetratricopeptide (TPR) repeat protein
MDKETSEIAKLTERISKDPKSKLFVPLAEEYKKAGDLEMAVFVLTEGLKNNPGYVTARSILGKLLLEKGDLDGSRKEFEEVAKSIPDNLMAQRKLGDIYVLQNMPDEALKHFKAVLSLNPRDEEIASLISELEAGSDVRSKIHLPTPPAQPDASVPPASQPDPGAQTLPPQAAAPLGKPLGAPNLAASSVAAPQAGPTRQMKAEGAPVFADQQQEKSAAMAAGAPASFDLQPTDEEPEEVLVVEPLEEAGAEPAEPSPGLDFLQEGDALAGSGSFGEEPAERSFLSNEFPAEEEPGIPGQVHAGTPAAEEERAVEDLAQPASEDFFMPDFSAPDQAETIEELPEQPPEPSEPAADDFTTDTLAELYISQGFYEKAIDIYERMLADKPNSRGLKDKLAGVRAMAGSSESGEAAPSEQQPGKRAEEKPAVFEPHEYVPPVETDEFSIGAEVLPARKERGTDDEQGFFSGGREYEPDEQPAERRSAKGRTSFDELEPASDFSRTPGKMGFTDFEPREYVPPKPEPVPEDHDEEREPVAQKTSKVNKKETIERLEAWLKNIKKET